MRTAIKASGGNGMQEIVGDGKHFRAICNAISTSFAPLESRGRHSGSSGGVIGESQRGEKSFLGLRVTMSYQVDFQKTRLGLIPLRKREARDLPLVCSEAASMSQERDGSLLRAGDGTRTRDSLPGKQVVAGKPPAWHKWAWQNGSRTDCWRRIKPAR